MTPRQAELLEKEDWRFHAIDAVGTGLGMLATTEVLAKRHRSFGLPSAPALYLSLASNAHERRSAIDVDACFVDHPKPQGTWPDNHQLLFDFFELFVADWDADEVQTLGRLLTKLENSKAAASSPEQRPVGRSWQKKSKEDK